LMKTPRTMKRIIIRSIGDFCGRETFFVGAIV
jgi:hypothetical protein